MKVICDRGVLVEALNLVSGVIVSRTPKPVLLCVKLEAGDGSLKLSATDLEVGIHLAIEQVEVQDDGAVVIPADKLTAIVRESADPTITIETEDEAAHIRGADSHFKIYGHAAAEFPAVGVFEGDADYEVKAGVLGDLIQKTIFATARETSRYAINGVLMERDGKKMTMVATDGRRLALARGACGEAKGDGAGCIVPTKALNLLLRLLDDPSEGVRVQIADNQAHFATDRATLTTNLVEGSFPPYKDVIPKEHDRKASFKTDVLASGVRRAALLTNEESKGVKFAFSSEGLNLSSRAPEMGEAEVSVPAESYSGDPVEIGFNPQFIVDVLKVADAEQVAIELKASNKPGTIKVGADFTYVVMPVSLG
ncbi:DNA polymerase III subunit beta [Planctomycetales bacterium ZRK34]|nr:DNA polymerase III subunit beta [Planctomycetales bacterium ZRK34]